LENHPESVMAINQAITDEVSRAQKAESKLREDLDKEVQLRND
jgi:hypothetical protein